MPDSACTWLIDWRSCAGDVIPVNFLERVVCTVLVFTSGLLWAYALGAPRLVLLCGLRLDLLGSA
eukprot:1812181-Amphidinium_carterae.1